MDLMSSDFGNEDLTEWLTIAWKCSQSPKSWANTTTLTSGFWAEESADKAPVPEVFKNAVELPGSNRAGPFFRAVMILSQRNVRVTNFFEKRGLLFHLPVAQL